MTCFVPLKAYRSHGGRIVFSSKEGFSDRPIELPCGQCRGCRMERSRQWGLRCIHEASMHEENSFITLTYRPKDLPADGSVDVREWQLFVKRLRKKAGKLRYYACGEYGNNLRPHYHACLFGKDFPDKREHRLPDGKVVMISPFLEEVWGKGFCTVGNLTYESAAYVARYVMKKVNGDEKEEHYQRVDHETGEVFRVRPEFATMSRRPGIGADWYVKFHGDVFPADEVIHEGRRFRPPRFYDSKLDEDVLDELKGRRRKKVADRAGELTPERLRARERVLESKLKRQSRNL